MKDKQVNENVEIVVLPTTVKATYGAREGNQIQKAVMDKLLLPSKEPYRKVQVEVKHRSDGSPKMLVASMLRAYTYTADIVKVHVAPDYNVKSIEPASTEE